VGATNVTIASLGLTTGQFTLADTSILAVTNAAKTAMITVGGAGFGTLTKLGGTPAGDNMTVGTNGALVSAQGEVWTAERQFLQPQHQ